ncbi:MAG: CARDB domain-containing protein [Opitutales bacterium]
MNTSFAQSLLRATAWLGLPLCLCGPLLIAQPEIASGEDFTAVVDSNNNLYTFGSNEDGVLGVGEAVEFSATVRLVEPEGVWQSVAVSRSGEGGAAHVLAIRTDGSLWAWGNNDRGQLGIDSTESVDEPVLVNDSVDWAEVAAGEDFSMARSVDGAVYVWGDNSYGQLAREIHDKDAAGIGVPDSTRNIYPTPRSLDANTYIAIAAGPRVALAVRSEGGVLTNGPLFSWGYSTHLQLGQPMSDGPSAFEGPVIAPQQVGGSSAWTDVFAGSRLCFGLQGGALYAWGGELNTGTGDVEWTPARVGSASNWVSVAIGADHTLGLRSDGSLYGWGDNENGALGLPLRTDAGNEIPGNSYKFSPVALETGSDFTAVGAGNDFSALLSSDGFLLSAGVNGLGQLGNSTSSSGAQDSFENGTLGVADLVATSLTITSEDLSPGGSITGNVALENLGTATITDDFSLGAVLSPNSNFDALGAIPLTFSGGETISTDIDPSGQLSAGFTVDLGTDIPSGSYFLVVLADDEQILSEITVANNDVAVDAEDVLSFEADLRPEIIEPIDDDPDSQGDSFPLVPGKPFEVTVRLHNEGAGRLPDGASFNHTARFVFSPTANIDGAGAIEIVPTDPTLLEYSDEILSGGFVDRTFRFLIPESVGVGDFYLGVEVDADEDIAEADETNNVDFTGSADVGVFGVDLSEALDNFELDFTLHGDGDWFGADTESLVGDANDDDAAVSPPIGEGETATIRTTVDVPSVVTFSWRSKTSNPDNNLSFSLLGASTGPGENVISGDVGWNVQQRAVPAGVQIMWTYTEGVEAAGDSVFLDNISVVPITGPDFVVDDASLTQSGLIVDSGRYVLGQSGSELDLSLQVRNQGLDHDSTDPDFDVRVYLSQDANFDPETDRLVRTIPNTSGIDQGETSILQPSITLPTDLDSGFYYLIAVVDEDNAVDNEVDDVPFPGGTGADVQENNVFISETANVEIVALPDLRVSGLNPEPGFYVVGESLDFDLTLENTGLEAAIGTMDVRIVLSDDNTLDENDYVIGEFPYSGGLAEGGAQGDSTVFTPDVSDIRADVPIGAFQYFGVIVDSGDDFEELNENNNTAFFPNPHFIFAEVELDEAVELDVAGFSVVNRESVPFSGDKPFVGQKSVTFDGEDAARSAVIGNNDTASFETSITTPTDTVLSFYWKVDSEYVILEDGGVKEDFLAVFVDGVQEDKISGDGDWEEKRIPLSAGTHTVTWAYVKDLSDSVGADAGWVDRINFTLPDLTVSNLTVPAQTVSPGDFIDFSFDIENVGLDPVPATPSFGVEVRLSSDPIWGNDDDVVLQLDPTPTNEGVLDAGETRSFDLSAEVPVSFADADDYFVAVRVDPDDDESDNPDNGPGVIVESDEGNNTVFTSTPEITVVPPISLREAIDDGDPDDVDGTTLELTTGGDGSWFGLDNQTAAFLPDGTLQGDAGDVDRDDVAQSGPIDALESAYFETTVAGPKVLKFRWRSDSRPGANFLEVSLNGRVRESVSGRVDWDFGYGPFTLTFEGDTTEAIRSGADPSVVEAALNALPSVIAAGGVTVTAPTATSYQIAFVENGTRDIMSFTSLTPNRVSSSTLSTGGTGQNGTPSQPEIQVLEIETDVYFRLSYRGQTTAKLSYLATATEVDAALNDLGTITDDGGVAVSAHPEAESALDFIVEFDDPGLRDLITVNAGGLKQPVTVEAELNSDRFKPGGSIGVEGDPTTEQVQPIRIGPEITLFVPAGAGDQTIRWTYRKTGNAGDYVDAGWVDQIRFLDFNGPELELSKLSYVPGEYVLDVSAIVGAPDQKLGTEVLDITVEAKNQGTGLPPAAGAFTSADLDVRLSSDRIYGNADDIVLGTFNQVEGELEAGNLLRFIGGLPLGDHIPEGFYYLMARFDANERVDEFTEANNLVISENRDVQITRLPRLVPDGGIGSRTESGYYNEFIDFDEVRFYTPRSPMRLRFGIQNVGLDSVLGGLYDGEDEWISQVNLIAVLREDLEEYLADTEATLEDFEGLTSFTMDLRDFSVDATDEPLLGRREGFPNGDRLDFNLELTLPTAGQIEMAADEDDVEDFAYYLQLVIDVDDEAVRESGSLNVWNSVDPFGAENSADPGDELFYGPDGLFSILSISSLPNTEAGYAAAYDATGGAADSDGDGLSDDFEYAFVRNPQRVDGAGIGFPGTYGTEAVDGAERLSVTFDFQPFATDIDYRVQAASNLAGPWDDLVLIDGPYFDSEGSGSLTGDGGLIDDPEVTAIVEEGASARITVIDSETVADEPMRFMRILVEGL